jgi:hypothetical protein
MRFRLEAIRPKIVARRAALNLRVQTLVLCERGEHDRSNDTPHCTAYSTQITDHGSRRTHPTPHCHAPFAVLGSLHVECKGPHPSQRGPDAPRRGDERCLYERGSGSTRHPHLTQHTAPNDAMTCRSTRHTRANLNSATGTAQIGHVQCKGVPRTLTGHPAFSMSAVRRTVTELA